ncbi:MAG: YdcF family protein [Azospirillaceae bacterium]
MDFALSKILWSLVAPGNALILGLVAGLIALAVGWRRIGGTLLALSTAGLVAIATLPLGTWLVAPLETRFERPSPMPNRVDGIIVLGGAMDPWRSHLYGEPQVNAAAERLFALAELLRRYPEARAIYTGGSGSLAQPEHRGAPAARDLLDRIGGPTERVTWEADSRNTWENALLSRDLMVPAPGETWLLVTSAFHMPRSMGIFRRVGWPVMPYPTDWRAAEAGARGIDFDLADTLPVVDTAVREWIGLVAYRAMGRTSALFPGAEPTAGG